MTTEQAAKIAYKVGDKVYATTVGLTGPCTIIAVGPAPATGKYGADWATETYDVREDRRGIKVLRVTAADLRPCMKGEED